MTEYLIQSNDLRALLTEEGGSVTSCTANIDWALGLDFRHVRDYFNKKGMYIIPVVDEESLARPTVLVVGHTEYTLKWVADILVRVTIHEGFGSRDLSFDEIPEALKNLL